MIYGLFLILCLYLPFQIALNPAERIDLASARVFIILLFLIWLIDGLKNKKLFIPFKIQTLLILSFLFLSAFSLFWAENLDWGVRKLLFLLSVFPVYFVTSGLRPAVIPSEVEESKKSKLDPSTPLRSAQDDNFKRLKIVKFLVYGAGIAAMIGIIQFLFQFVIGIDQTAHIWRTYITPVFLGQAFSQAVLEYPSWLVNIGGHNYLRAFATFPDPHMFSFYLGLALPLAMGLYFYKRSKCHSAPPLSRGQAHAESRKSNYLLDSRLRGNDTWRGDGKKYLILFFIILLADLLTFSRGGYIGLAGGLVFIILYFVINKKISAKKFLISLVLAIIIFASLAFTPIGRRFYASFSADEGSNRIRFENWRQAVEVIKNNSQGAGIGNYSYKIEPSAGYRKPIYAHSLYLDIAAETGVINAIIFTMLLMYSIRSCIFRSKDSLIYLGGAAGLVIFSIHSLFDTALYSVQVLPLLLIIISISAANEK